MDNDVETKASPVKSADQLPVRHPTREQWLRAAMAQLSVKIKDSQASGSKLEVPEVHVSVGFAKGVRSSGGRAVGLCCYGEASEDGNPHVFVCPTVGDAREALAILTHELCHAAVGPGHGHKGEFIKAMKAVGMRSPWTQSIPTDEYAEELRRVHETLGGYPHAALSPTGRKKQVGRNRPYGCPCGVKVRVASDDFDATCNKCGEAFVKREPKGK